MAKRVRFRSQDGLAWITLSARDASGRARGFTPELRQALGGLLEMVGQDRKLRGLVIQGDETGWPRGADPLDDYETDPEAPDLADLAAQISALELPVLARLSGRLEGGALALSQAADLRIAGTDSLFAAPETALGVFPGAGALVRLARRAGGAAALEFVTATEPVEAAAAISAGLCDLVLGGADAGQIAAALDLLIDEGVPRADAALDDPGTYLSALEPLRAGAGAQVVPRLLEVVESALLLPLDEALDFDAVAFAELSEAPLSRALRHAAHCDALSQTVPGEAVGSCPPAPIRVGIWDQSPVFATALLAAGYEVVFGASDPGDIEAAFKAIARAQEEQVQNGALDPETREADWARLGAAMARNGVSNCEALIVSGDPADFPPARLRLRSAGAVPEALAEPVAIFEGGVCELVPARAQSEDTLFESAALLRQGGFPVLLGGTGAAGIVAHLRLSYIAAAERVVLAGATVAQLDTALAQDGVRLPPLRLADMLGLDSVLAEFERLHLAPGPLLELLVLEGQTGRAKGQGVYDWSSGEPRPVADQGEMLGALRREAGISPRRLSRSEIRARIFAELANTGVWLLQRAQAHRPCDIDLAARHALGLPAHLGGVMFAADQAGLLATRKRLRGLAEEGAPEPATLWDVLIRNGKRFGDLDRE